MQERVKLTDAQINKDLLRSMFENPLWYWILVGVLGLGVLCGFAAAAYMINRGLGVTGLNRPVMWGFFITNFVFWIGISHAGVMLSAILRLVQAEWRRPDDSHAHASYTCRSTVASILLGVPLRLGERDIPQR